jgi:predicted MFS family arabinose efflux permease
VLLGAWGIGYAALTVFNQQVILVVGHEAPDTVTSVSVVVIQLGIAMGAAVGGLTINTIGIGWVPLCGAVFAAASVALLIGLRRYLQETAM